MKHIRIWTLFVVLVFTIRVAAQADCPSIVQAALDATDEQCRTTSRNQACYGNVNLQAAPQPGVGDFTFSDPGDIVGVDAIQTLSLSSQVKETGEWGVALMRLQANIPESTPGQNVTFLLFGDVQITNGVENQAERVTFSAVTQADVNVYSEPSTDSALVVGLVAGDSVTLDGRSADGYWFHVSASDALGWVQADALTPAGDLETLTILDSSGAALNPMQAFYFRSGIGDAPCAEAPDSGILVQTPAGVRQIQFTVNNVNISLGSTAYLQAQPGGVMTTSVVEGAATVEAGGSSVVVPEGSFTSVPLDAQGRAAGPPSQPQPYDAAKMTVLPIRILPRVITIAAPLSAGGTAIIPAAGEWQWTTGTPSAEGCPDGTAELVAPGFTPSGPFRLPGDDFSLLILVSAAFGPSQSSAPPGAVFSNPDPNTYVADFSDGGGEGHYEAQVINLERIEGQFQYTSQGCTIVIPFVVTRIGD